MVNDMKKKCEVCGKEFNAGHSSQKYCSVKCYHEAIKRKPVSLDPQMPAVLTTRPILIEDYTTPSLNQSPPNGKGLVALLTKKGEKITVTVTLSDLHLGCTTFLPLTWYSTISGVLNFLRILKSQFKIVHTNLLFNGDVVAGKDVYDMQIFDNIVQRGHWMVQIAETLCKEVIEGITKTTGLAPTVYCIKGTHEQEDENYTIYLSKLLGAKYLSRAGVVNIADPLGGYNILFTHGTGYSEVTPVTAATIRETQAVITEYALKGIRIERINTAHTHWLAIVGKYSVSGGFQKYQPKLSQRPSGALIDVYIDGNDVPILIAPSPEVEEKEKASGILEFTNFLFYATKLLKSLKDQGVDGGTLAEIQKKIHDWYHA
jgi:hypothetical protein